MTPFAENNVPQTGAKSKPDNSVSDRELLEQYADQYGKGVDMGQLTESVKKTIGGLM